MSHPFIQKAENNHPVHSVAI